MIPINKPSNNKLSFSLIDFTLAREFDENVIHKYTNFYICIRNTTDCELPSHNTCKDISLAYILEYFPIACNTFDRYTLGGILVILNYLKTCNI